MAFLKSSSSLLKALLWTESLHLLICAVQITVRDGFTRSTASGTVIPFRHESTRGQTQGRQSSSRDLSSAAIDSQKAHVGIASPVDVRVDRSFSPPFTSALSMRQTERSTSECQQSARIDDLHISTSAAFKCPRRDDCVPDLDNDQSTPSICSKLGPPTACRVPLTFPLRYGGLFSKRNATSGVKLGISHGRDGESQTPRAFRVLARGGAEFPVVDLVL